jgi:hypothetical protein
MCVSEKQRKAMARHMRLPPGGQQMRVPEHFRLYFRASWAHLLRGAPAPAEGARG